MPPRGPPCYVAGVRRRDEILIGLAVVAASAALVPLSIIGYALDAATAGSRRRAAENAAAERKGKAADVRSRRAKRKAAKRRARTIGFGVD